MINKLTAIASLGGRQTNPGQPGERSPLVPQLETGKVLSATVVESQGKNVFLLEAAGTQFSVQSGLPLSKGEQVRFQVLSTNPVLELQKIEDPLPAQIRRTLPLTGEPVNLTPLLRNLQTTFFFGPRPTSEQAIELRGIGLPVAEKGMPLQGATPGSSQTTQTLMQKMEPEAVAQLLRQGNYTVKATVLENQGDNKSLVRIGSESYRLEGPIGGRPGDSRVLQLRSLQPAVTFLPVGDGGDPVKSAQPLTLITQGQELPALVRALQLPIFTGLDLLNPSQQQVLKDFQSLQPAQLQEPGAGELLKKGLEQLGIRSEAMVAQGRGQETAAQLKTLLAEITKLFQGQEEISAQANRLLSTLENSQFLQAVLNNDSIFLFPLPFSFVEKGYLMVEREGGQQGGEREQEESFNCTLHLSLEGLGDVRVNFIQNEETIRLSFFLESREKAEFVSGFDKELK
ncbi:MAG: hypothetical protein KKD01_19045, partial [Proteobacteria bacterium]|nr:hypothetical protein [Pseudomonadota bacterium]